MFNLDKLDICQKYSVENPKAYCMRLREKSNAKSTMEGHFEMMGVYTEVPFLTFTDTGFPNNLLKEI